LASWRRWWATSRATTTSCTPSCERPPGRRSCAPPSRPPTPCRALRRAHHPHLHDASALPISSPPPPRHPPALPWPGCSNEYVGGLSALHAAAASLRRLPGGALPVEVPAELLSYLDDGGNPDVFLVDVMRSCQAAAQAGKGKVEGFRCGKGRRLGPALCCTGRMKRGTTGAGGGACGNSVLGCLLGGCRHSEGVLWLVCPVPRAACAACLPHRRRCARAGPPQGVARRAGVPAGAGGPAAVPGLQGAEEARRCRRGAAPTRRHLTPF
jgi:hypothetical protein